MVALSLSMKSVRQGGPRLIASGVRQVGHVHERSFCMPLMRRSSAHEKQAVCPLGQTVRGSLRTPRHIMQVNSAQGWMAI